MSLEITNSYAQRIRELKLNPIKIGIISDSSYQHFRNIRLFYSKLLTLPNYIIILAGGSEYGADDYIREVTFEVEFEYREYNPIYTRHNTFSAMPKYLYGKKFSTKYLVSRYNNLIKDCDKLVVFDSGKGEDVFIASIIKKINENKIAKPAVVIN